MSWNCSLSDCRRQIAFVDVEVALIHHPVVAMALNPVKSALESGFPGRERERPDLLLEPVDG